MNLCAMLQRKLSIDSCPEYIKKKQYGGKPGLLNGFITNRHYGTCRIIFKSLTRLY